jgi:hypothetical protein
VLFSARAETLFLFRLALSCPDLREVHSSAPRCKRAQRNRPNFSHLPPLCKIQGMTCKTPPKIQRKPTSKERSQNESANDPGQLTGPKFTLRPIRCPLHSSLSQRSPLPSRRRRSASQFLPPPPLRFHPPLSRSLPRLRTSRRPHRVPIRRPSQPVPLPLTPPPRAGPPLPAPRRRHGLHLQPSPPLPPRDQHRKQNRHRRPPTNRHRSPAPSPPGFSTHSAITGRSGYIRSQPRARCILYSGRKRRCAVTSAAISWERK